MGISDLLFIVEFCAFFNSLDQFDSCEKETFSSPHNVVSYLILMCLLVSKVKRAHSKVHENKVKQEKCLFRT